MTVYKHRTGAFTVGRRAFLAGTGGVILSLPFIEAIHGIAKAAPSQPRRFVVWHQGQGTQYDQWAIPGSSETDFRFGRILEPLTDLRDRFTFVYGVDNKARALSAGDGHVSTASSILCGMPNYGGPSIDQVVFERLRQPGHRSPLHLAIGRSARTGRFLTGPNARAESVGNPRQVFDSLFTSTMGSADELARIRARRGRALDAVRDSFRSFRSGLGAADRERLDRHEQGITEVETRVTTSRECAPPTLGGSYDPLADWVRASADMFEISTMAFACDLTPVITIEWTEDHDPAQFAAFRGGYAGWHEEVHAGETRRGLTGLHEGYRYYATRMGEMLRRFDAYPEGDGTMLDHTTVLWTADFGYGGGHNGKSVQVALAGTLGAGVPMGRLLRFGNVEDLWARAQWSTNNVFVSILQAFGQTDTRFGHVGAASDYGPVLEGPLPGLLG